MRPFYDDVVAWYEVNAPGFVEYGFVEINCQSILARKKNDSEMWGGTHIHFRDGRKKKNSAVRRGTHLFLLTERRKSGRK